MPRTPKRTINKLNGMPAYRGSYWDINRIPKPLETFLEGTGMLVCLLCLGRGECNRCRGKTCPDCLGSGISGFTTAYTVRKVPRRKMAATIKRVGLSSGLGHVCEP